MAYLLTLCRYVPDFLPQFLARHGSSETQSVAQEQATALKASLVHLIQQAGKALSTAHANGVAHGAIVPGNILLDDQGHLWVADFGLARLHPPPPPYLAPELYDVSRASRQAGNMAAFWEAANPISDQYMLAILCQQLFARLLRPEDWEHLRAVLHRATDQNPTRRFASIDAFVYDLVVQMSRGRSVLSGGSLGGQTRGILQVNQQEAIERSERYRLPRPPDQVQYGGAASGRFGALPVPTQSDDWEQLGGKFFAAHDYDNAVHAYLRALELDPSRATAWLALGDAYFASENYPGALSAYEQAVLLNPNDPMVWTNRGTTLDALGRHGEAVQCYERADQLNAE